MGMSRREVSTNLQNKTETFLIYVFALTSQGRFKVSFYFQFPFHDVICYSGSVTMVFGRQLVFFTFTPPVHFGVSYFSTP